MRDLQAALIDQAEAHADAVMPGFTHLQIAQPVTFGHHLLAYVEMIGRDRGRLRRLPPPAQRMPARRRRARRHGVSDRPRRDGRGARLRPAGGQFARRRVGPRFRDRISRRRGARRHASVALRRGDRALVERRVSASSGSVRRVHDRQLDHAAKAQPRRRRAGARQDRPAQRRARCIADGDEGAAARLSEGHAGGQGAGVRGGRRARTVPRGDGRHGARHAARPRSAARGGRRAASAPPPTSPTGWCACSGMPFRRAHHVTGEIVKRAEAQGLHAGRTAARRVAGGRAGDHRRRVRGARCRALGGEPHQLRRHRAGAGARGRRRGAPEVSDGD